MAQPASPPWPAIAAATGKPCCSKSALADWKRLSTLAAFTLNADRTKLPARPGPFDGSDESASASSRNPVMRLRSVLTVIV